MSCLSTVSIAACSNKVMLLLIATALVLASNGQSSQATASTALLNATTSPEYTKPHHLVIANRLNEHLVLTAEPVLVSGKFMYEVPKVIFGSNDTQPDKTVSIIGHPETGVNMTKLSYKGAFTGTVVEMAVSDSKWGRAVSVRTNGSDIMLMTAETVIGDDTITDGFIATVHVVPIIPSPVLAKLNEPKPMHASEFNPFYVAASNYVRSPIGIFAGVEERVNDLQERVICCSSDNMAMCKKGKDSCSICCPISGMMKARCGCNGVTKQNICACVLS